MERNAGKMEQNGRNGVDWEGMKKERKVRKGRNGRNEGDGRRWNERERYAGKKEGDGMGYME